MGGQRTTPQPGNRPERPATNKSRPQATSSERQAADRDSFPEIQAESGRRMRPIVAEHYGESE